MEKSKKNIAEESCKLTLADFGRKILQPSTKKNGRFIIKNGSQPLFVFYRIYLEKKPALLNVIKKAVKKIK